MEHLFTDENQNVPIVVTTIQLSFPRSRIITVKKKEISNMKDNTCMVGFVMLAFIFFNVISSALLFVRFL